MPPAPRIDVMHLDDNAASEFVSGSLTPSAQSRIEAHLASCRDCRALVAALAMDAGTDSHADTLPQEPPEPSSPSQAAQQPTRTRTFTIGHQVGRYVVLSALGAGGMGVVFAAYDPQLDRKIALKLLRAGITYNTQDARTRLRREAQAIAQLSHPNVVNVYDVGNADEGDLYIAMEFVEGDTLTSWLKRYPRTWREIVDVFLQAARGLYAAHSVGLLHRDFKPDNVLVGGDGRVRVTDFGLARSLITPEDVARSPNGGRRPSSHSEPSALNVELTATGTVLGTPRYMAPEQLKGPDIDARADQFSFCVALYEALYGVHPLPGSTAVAMLEKREKAQPPPETVKIPPAIVRAIMTGLERDRSKRFPSMGALIAALAPLQQRSPARYVAFALSGLLAAGIAFAWIIRPPEPVGGLVDVPTTDDLIKKINELQDELRRRDAKIEVLVAEVKQLQPNVEKIQQLQSEIAARDEKIGQLLVEVTKLKPPAKPLPTKPPPEVAFPAGVFNQVQNDLVSCIDEWNRRQPGDARLSYRMTVSADGVGHSAEALPATAADDRLGPALHACVGPALERVRFAPSPDNLDLVVDIQWTAETKAASVAPRIVKRWKATTALD